VKLFVHILDGSTVKIIGYMQIVKIFRMLKDVVQLVCFIIYFLNLCCCFGLALVNSLLCCSLGYCIEISKLLL